MKRYLTSGVFSLLVLADSARAESMKLLTCVDLSATMVGQCKLSSAEVAPQKPFEMDFSITYKYPCSGPFEFYLETPISREPNSPLNSVPLEFSTAEKTTVIRGVGPVVTIDRKPNLTKIRPVSKECNLEIISSSSKASERQQIAWKDELTKLKNLLASYQDNVKAYEALAVLEPAFENYDKLLSSVSSDAGNNSELLQASKGLLSCADSSNDEGCETLIDKLVDARTLLSFSDDQSAKITKLQKTLGAADLTGVFECTSDASEPCVTVDKFLKKYLTTDDIAKLATAREKLKDVVGAKDKLSTYAESVKATEVSIAQLEALMKEYE